MHPVGTKGRQQNAQNWLWLARPVVCAGQIVLEGLDPNALTDSDLRGISLRMRVILDSIEWARCEGRLLPRGLFDALDTLDSMVLHGPSPHLSDWESLVIEFGEYYKLDGSGPISVDPRIFRETAKRYAFQEPKPPT